MGERGPLPRRTAERRRRNATPGATSVRMEGEVKPPPLPAGTHAIARRLYNSLKTSGQAAYFEPSDWAAALLAAEVTTRFLNSRRVNGQVFSGVWDAWKDLLVTEGARRRALLEVERGEVEDDEPSERVTAMADYRKVLGQ